MTMWGTDRDTAAKHGAYRVVIPAKRKRQRDAIQRMVETFMDERILVVEEYTLRGLTVFCTCRRQANLLANHFNGQLTYLLKVCYTTYSQLVRKSRAIEEILEQQGTKRANMNNYYHFSVDEKLNFYDRRTTNYYYLPCRRSVILAKLSIADLTEF